MAKPRWSMLLVGFPAWSTMRHLRGELKLKLFLQGPLYGLSQVSIKRIIPG